MRVQQGISPLQKPTKREIPFHIVTRNDELKEFFNKLLVALGLPYSIVPVSYAKHLRFVMAKNKQRAVSILLFLGGILVLMAMWDFPDSPSPQVK